MYPCLLTVEGGFPSRFEEFQWIDVIEKEPMGNFRVRISSWFRFAKLWLKLETSNWCIDCHDIDNLLNYLYFEQKIMDSLWVVDDEDNCISFCYYVLSVKDKCIFGKHSLFHIYFQLLLNCSNNKHRISVRPIWKICCNIKCLPWFKSSSILKIPDKQNWNE